jgi:hypothetical protein
MAMVNRKNETGSTFDGRKKWMARGVAQEAQRPFLKTPSATTQTTMMMWMRSRRVMAPK